MLGGFRRSNKRGNVRKRIETKDSDEENEEGEMETDSPVATPKPVAALVETKSSKIKKSSSALSFGGEEDETDTFVVKKSKASLNMNVKVRKEKKKKKKKGKKDLTEDEDEIMEDVSEIKAKVKPPPLAVSGGSFQIKTFSDDEEVDDATHRFSARGGFGRPGDIPDAATIYAMKKQREQARQFGGGQNYIPMNSNKHAGRFPSENSRLVREEMEMNSSDEERMEMKGKQTYDPYLERRSQVAKALEEAGEMEEEEQENNQDEEELRNWENEQINKGTKIPANAYKRPALPNPVPMVHHEPPTIYSIPNSDQSGIVSVDYITKKLAEELSTKKQLHRMHSQDFEKIKGSLASSKENIENLEEKAEQLDEKFSFFQDMRGFSKDLIECLGEKVKTIKSLEEAIHQSMKKRNELIANRRQNDVKDEAQEIQGKTTADSDRVTNLRNRRIAEREARRTRRREYRQRSIGGSDGHFGGQSSDDELIPSDSSKFKADKEKVIKERELVFEDVNSSFSSVKEILSRFEQWKFGFNESYKDAFMGLCIPKLMAPFVKMDTLTWNPLETKNNVDFEDMSWYKDAAMYGHHGDSIDTEDDDLNLLPLIVEKILVPKLIVLTQDVWDPLSKQQTRLLVYLVKRLVDDYPTMTKESKGVQRLMETIVLKLKTSVETDLFIPLYPRSSLQGKNPKALIFLERQFWKGVKLFDNVMQWNLILSQKKLQELGVDAILNRYLIMALQQFPDPLSSFEKCKHVVNLLPKDWFDKNSDNVIGGLQAVARYLVGLASTAHANSLGYDENYRKRISTVIKKIISLLMHIQAFDEARAVATDHKEKKEEA
ncbi:PAX3- and PAX7-binding protein 1-like [Clytia hemisphaerica]|uniref:GCF C-terminal domain-containing protein n=1 Tax=Clytia hemisphaerica TaxID=252671 RepID=A0A7M5VAA4_9CNID|eukprot:TCONS_00021635-protein